jgi:dTDP-4-amino-4,6-dideoxy-D-glucose ammonia-lyase
VHDEHRSVVWSDSRLPQTSSSPARFLPPEEVLVVGGGRWGRILCDALLHAQHATSRVHLVSRHNFRGALSWLAERRRADKGNTYDRLAVWNSLDDALEGTAAVAALVANSPARHYETARKLLVHGKHVLVEKPFVPTLRQANELTTLADSRGLVLAVGHEFLFASYMYHARARARQHLPTVDRASVAWHDVAREQRWGSRKSPDYTTNVVADIFPHVLSQLTVLFGPHDARQMEVTLAQAGEAASLTLLYGSVPVDVSLSRTAQQPRRVLTIASDTGRTLSVDFTHEPPELRLDGEVVPTDPEWSAHPRPVDGEIRHFLHRVRDQSHHIPSLAAANRHIVKATEAVGEQIQRQKESLIREQILACSARTTPSDVVVALREYLIDPMLDQGLIEDPKDQRTVDRWMDRAFYLIRTLANAPFTTQQELAAETGLRRRELVRLNAVLRQSDVAQRLILRCGHGAQYWQNSILPLMRSGSVEKALDEEYGFPHRIGLYPGLSCMLYCTFCGRNYDARYEREAAGTGATCFERIIREAPKTDPNVFYISGGLEPLTNPRIGNLIQFGTEHGFNLSLYTNALMLTPRLLDRQPGLWDLASLRISLHGVDAETSFRVNRHARGFEQATKNAADFLRLRNERGSSLRLGFNFVILPGRAEQVLQLAEVIAGINRAAGGGRQVDFLTLREDFTAKGEDAIQEDERARLVEIFSQLEERRRREDLCDLHIDFGYALSPLERGEVSRQLEMVENSEMRKRAFPQVSVVVDPLGDVYAYREAGFLDRPGARRYVIGNVLEQGTMEDVVRQFLAQSTEFENLPGDTLYLDIFDHVVTKLLNQTEADQKWGISSSEGPVPWHTSDTAKRRGAPTIAHFNEHAVGV